MRTRKKTVAFLILSSLLSACGGGGGGGGGTVPAAAKTIQLNGQGKQVSYTYDVPSQSITTISAAEDVSASAVFAFDTAGVLTGLLLTSASTVVGNFGAGDLSVLAHDADFVIAQNATSRAIMSSPTNGTWDYQSFGVWENGLDANSGFYGAMSLGTPTAGTAIPGAGAANFSGKVIGSYVNDLGKGHTVLATLNVGVDWSTRSLSLTTSGTQISADGVNFGAPPVNLDISGNLTYAAGTNGFSGTLTTTSGLSGDSSGQFYGPSAEELGGAFFLHGSGVETYSGAYGATR